EEGVAIRASDIDMACILGYGWPPYTGGPMFWGERVGLAKIVAKLKELQAMHGDFFKPAALLEKLAAEGRMFS
ncbi:MAG: 3-hydroxyacyl-CoA dehydrogenase, partial [Alphaproteobacteria bacterium]|nr:3-hydroxyacyl-CoA dehydrogenase [Alphaproteobacteria bacterium]